MINRDLRSDFFLNIKFNLETLDLFFIRNSIFQALERNAANFSGQLLDIGCGKMPYKNYLLQNSSIKKYIGLDIESAIEYDINVKPDFTWDGLKMPFENDSFDTTFATEVLEHCPDPQLILKETYRVLKTGGVFFFTVPFLWPLHEVPHDEYRYTPFALKRLLEESGFINIDIRATGGWHASMAQMLGLWLRRSPLRRTRRRLLSKILKPVIKYLIKIDKYSKYGFTESQMITGLSGIAYK